MGDKKGSGIPRPRTPKEVESDNKAYTFLTKEQIMQALENRDKSGSPKKKPK